MSVHRDTIPAPHPSKLLASDWVQLVFHVLAHVPSSVPSSAENPRYAKWVGLQLGNPWARELGQDVQILESLACSHSSFARLQALAWLHPNIDAALAGAESSLRELDAETVQFAPGIQQGLLPVAAEVEVLRCAALLEAAHEARLHASFLAWQAEEECEKLEFELSRVFASAPRLASLGVKLVPALGFRGRVHEGTVYIGLPNREVGPSAQHAAWQAAHEATVHEVAEAYTEFIALAGASVSGAQPLPSSWGSIERLIEQIALLVLQRRAERNRVAGHHRRWLSHWSDPQSLLTVPLSADVESLIARLAPI